MFSTELNGINMVFHTSPNLFSPNGPDAGTLALISCVEPSQNDKILDLGCGYGLVGIYAAKLVGAERVTMTDADGSAVVAAVENARLNGVPEVRILQSDGFAGIDDAGYTLILSNPPYHADFSVAKSFIEKGFNRLSSGGKMAMVTKRRDWYKNKFISIFGGVTIKEIDGYFIFIAEKRSNLYANK